MGKILFWISVAALVLIVVIFVSRQCAAQEYPDLDWLSRSLDLANARLDEAQARADTGCRADTSLWVEQAAAEDLLLSVETMFVFVRPNFGAPTSEYGRWLADHMLEASNRATIIAEQIRYACGAGETRSAPPTPVAPIISTDPPVAIIVKGVVVNCGLLLRIFDEMPSSETEPYTYVGDMMELLGDASGRTANFDNQDARTALAECGVER